MRRDGQAVLLLLLGAAMLRLGFHPYGHYGVNRVVAGLAGLALVVVAGAALWQHLEERAGSVPPPPVDETAGGAGRHIQEEHDSWDSDEGPDRLRSGWLLLVPVLVLLLIVP